MIHWNEIVSPEGYLIEDKISSHTPIYKGMNGRLVERFTLPFDEQTSYIFKPITHDGQGDRESWVYEHILHGLPEVYPKMIAKSSNGSTSWVIYEDMGPIHHEHDTRTIAEVIRLMAKWHGLPVAHLQGVQLSGHKPSIHEMARQLLVQEGEVMAIQDKLLLDRKLLGSIAEVASGRDQLFGIPLVLSHGDLHAGNFGRSSDRLYILDWEHAHLNSPLWDLYHVLDIPHPDFPRSELMTYARREQLLDEYARQSTLLGRELNRFDLYRDYYTFAFIFSLWLSLLIVKDLGSGSDKWTREQLLTQREETFASIRSCALRLEVWDKNAFQMNKTNIS